MRSIYSYVLVSILVTAALAGCADPEAPAATAPGSSDEPITNNPGTDPAVGTPTAPATPSIPSDATNPDPNKGTPEPGAPTDSPGAGGSGGTQTNPTPTSPTSKSSSAGGSPGASAPSGTPYEGSGFVLAVSLEGALASMAGSTSDDLRGKLLSKFPASGGYALGVYLNEASLQHLGDPVNLLRNDGSILVMKGFSGDASKLHYLQVKGKTFDLASYVGVTTSTPIRLIVADSHTEASPTTMSVKDITAWTASNPTFASTQGYAFGTTMKTITKTAAVAGVVTAGTATAALETINRLPFDVGVYDTAQFEGTNPTDTRSYHVTAVRFFGGTTPEIIDLAQPPYTLAARDVQVKGFLVPLSDPAKGPSLSALADQWTGKTNVLPQLSSPTASPLNGFAGSDFLGAFGKGTQNYQQAKAIFLVVELSLAPPTGNHRLKDVTTSTFSAPVTHTQIQGYAAPTGNPGTSVLMDFTFANAQPKLYQMPLLHPNAAGAITIDGIFIRANAQDSSIAQSATTALTQNQWAKAVADAGNTWSNVIVTNNGVLYPYKITPTGLGAPLPMLLKLSGGQLSWTPTIANNFAKYEVRQSTFPPTSATDGTLLTSITNPQTTTYSLSTGATGYFVVWAFNDQGNTPSTPVYVEPAPTVGLTSVTYCTSNVRTCLHATWSQYSGSGFEKYELNRRTGSGSWTVAQTITSASTTSISDNGLTCGTTYDYKIVVYANGKSGESNVMTGNPNNGFGFCDQPSTTLNYVVYCSTNQKTCLKSGWTAYSGQGFEKYELQRRVGTSGSWTVAATITNAGTTDYSDNGLTCGTTYNYRIVLYVAGGSSESNVLAGNPNNGFGGCF